MGKFLDSLKPDYARPTLRGLVVEADSADQTLSAGELFSWLDVQQCQKGDTKQWCVVGADGKTIRRSKKFLVLQLRDIRSNRTAIRARDRALRIWLDDPTFRFRCRLPEERAGNWCMTCFGAAFLVVGAVFLFRVAKSMDSFADAQIPELDSVRFLTWFVLAGLALLFGVMPVAGVIFGIRQLRTRFVRSVTISGVGIRGVLDDGSGFSQPWTRLQAITRRAILFQDGSRIDFGPGGRRLAPWLAAVKERVFGLSRRGAKNYMTRIAIRMSIVTLVLLPLSSLAFQRVAPVMPRPADWFTMWLGFSAIVVFLVAILWFEPLAVSLRDYLERRQRRQVRQRKAAASQAHHPFD